ncbi:MAG: MoxR family ATPase [Microbacteriaceae bacterium]|nr:MoxR family ATPase [Burkholderiaceae bacterium]
MSDQSLPTGIDDTIARLGARDYIADRQLATCVYLALKLQRPLFLEGEPGTGKTEIARTLAAMLGRPLIRLQCYEGLDLAGAAYEWNYGRQMMEIRLAEATGAGVGSSTKESRDALANELFSERFLTKRALLQAIDPANTVAPVLLIDELDRADEPFEAFLLEVLGDFQITIPELGTVKATKPPIVILTSNRTREIHDAVKRRCLYHWDDFPDEQRELEILHRRVPGVSDALASQIVAFVQGLRTIELYKLPGIAETIEWTRALMELDAMVLDPEVVQHTLGVLLKYQDDIARMQGSEAARLLEQARGLSAQAPAALPPGGAGPSWGGPAPGQARTAAP